MPVITGVRDGQVILHVRTLLDGEEKIIAKAFATAFTDIANLKILTTGLYGGK